MDVGNQTIDCPLHPLFRVMMEMNRDAVLIINISALI